MKQKYKVLMIILFFVFAICFVIFGILSITLNKKYLLYIGTVFFFLWIVTIPCFYYAGFSWNNDNF